MQDLRHGDCLQPGDSPALCLATRDKRAVDTPPGVGVISKIDLQEVIRGALRVVENCLHRGQHDGTRS